MTATGEVNERQARQVAEQAREAQDDQRPDRFLFRIRSFINPLDPVSPETVSQETIAPVHLYYPL